MRDFEFYDLKSETPVPKNQRIPSKSILTHHDEDVNERLTPRDYIRFIAVVAMCWFFFYTEQSLLIGFIGLLASLAVLFLVGGDGQ